mgnify:CR=1 FL=1
MGMRFQLLRESRISSPGRGLPKPKVEAPRKRLTSGHMTQARRGRRLTKDRRQARNPFWAHGALSSKHTHTLTHTHTHTHTSRQREGKKLTEGERQREKRKWETHKHIHTQRESYSSGAETNTPRQPLRLRGSALDQNDLRLREQPTGLQADPSSRSRGHDLWGDSPEQRPGGPEAGMRRRFPLTPPVLSTSCSALCHDSRRPENVLSTPWRGQAGASEPRHPSTATEGSCLPGLRERFL